MLLLFSRYLNSSFVSQKKNVQCNMINKQEGHLQTLWGHRFIKRWNFLIFRQLVFNFVSTEMFKQNLFYIIIYTAYKKMRFDASSRCHETCLHSSRLPVLIMLSHKVLFWFMLVCVTCMLSFEFYIFVGRNTLLM